MEAHGRPLNSAWMFPELSTVFPESSLNFQSLTSCRFLAQLQLIIILMEVLCGSRGNTWWTPSNTPGIRRLVLLTLVLGSHVGKVYTADDLGTCFKCFLQCWNGGPRASPSTPPAFLTLLPKCCMNFQHCFLYVSWLLKHVAPPHGWHMHNTSASALTPSVTFL
jgi:hypothetical protein